MKRPTKVLAVSRAQIGVWYFTHFVMLVILTYVARDLAGYVFGF